MVFEMSKLAISYTKRLFRKLYFITQTKISELGFVTSREFMVCLFINRPLEAGFQRDWYFGWIEFRQPSYLNRT